MHAWQIYHTYTHPFTHTQRHRQTINNIFRDDSLILPIQEGSLFVAKLSFSFQSDDTTKPIYLSVYCFLAGLKEPDHHLQYERMRLFCLAHLTYSFQCMSLASVSISPRNPNYNIRNCKEELNSVERRKDILPTIIMPRFPLQRSEFNRRGSLRIPSAF